MQYPAYVPRQHACCLSPWPCWRCLTSPVWCNQCSWCLCVHITCGCSAYISICNHAWLVECGWSSAGLTTDPRKLVLATTGENWALEILSNDHIKNYFKMFHQALLLMDILEWKLSFACQILITAALVMNSRGSRLGWRHIYWINVCVKVLLCKKF